jgi:hypothetical protein
MAILDSQGRLFGKISVIDLGAALIILLVVAGIFLFPGSSGSVAQLGSTSKPVEVDLMVRGLTVADPQGLIDSIKEDGKTSVIIRNQPYGEVGVKDVQPLPRSVAVPQPDGTVVSYPDPRPELNFTVDMIVTLSDEAQIIDSGVVFGNNKVKIGTQMEIEGLLYRFNTTVVGLRVLE